MTMMLEQFLDSLIVSKVAMKKEQRARIINIIIDDIAIQEEVEPKAQVIRDLIFEKYIDGNAI